MWKGEYAMTMISTPEGIAMYRLLAIKGGIRMEIAGLGRSGRSACAIAKAELGLPMNLSRKLTLAHWLKHIKNKEEEYGFAPSSN